MKCLLSRGGGWLLASGMLLTALSTPQAVLAQSQVRFASTESSPTPAAGPTEAEPQRKWTPPQDRVASRQARRWSDPSLRAAAQRSSRRSAELRSAPQPQPAESMDASVQIEEGAQIIGPAEKVQPFQSELEPDSFHGYGPGNGCGCGGDSGGACDCGVDCDCGDCCGSCGDCCEAPGRKHCICFDLCWLQDLQIQGGVHAFQSPGHPTFGTTGNFGFQEGLNFGAPLPLIGRCSGIGWQIGYQALQSNFFGRFNNPNNFASESIYLDQGFFTLGLFHRALCGLQGGIVWDHMTSEYNNSTIPSYTFQQIRGEVSYVGPRQNEIGFLCNIGITGDRPGFPQNANVANGPFTYVSDFYGGFLRKRACNGGEGRILLGAVGPGLDFRQQGAATFQDRLLIGADVHLPLGEKLAIDAGFTYLLPLQNDDFNNAATREGWNIGINLVWYPFRSCLCPRQNACWGQQRQFRPLFNVADNGNFFLGH
jgi:hypothetical protein